MDLKNFTNKLKNKLKNKLEILDGKTKGDKRDILGKPVTISNYGFIKSKDGDYAFFTIKENENFYNASSLLTDYLKQIDENGGHEDVVNEGLPILLTEKISSSNRKYIDVEFYPSDLPF